MVKPFFRILWHLSLHAPIEGEGKEALVVRFRDKLLPSCRGTHLAS